MRNYILYLTAAIIVIALTFACGGGSNPPVAVTAVTLDKIALTLMSGQQEPLGATVEPEDAVNKAVSWTSSDKRIAVVTQDGVVTALVPGQVSIIATTQDGGKTAICTVTVISTDIAVTGVTLDKNSLTLTSGMQENLVATVLPADATNKDVTWTSSDTRIAVVTTSGMVTALNPGNVAIVVSTKDGGKTAVCGIEVTPSSVIYVTGVTLNKTSLTLAVGDEETLEALVHPDTATNKAVTWFSTEADIATVTQNGLVTAHKAGEAIIVVSTEDGRKTAACNLIVTFTTVPATGVTLDKISLTLVPNDTEQLKATVLPTNATNKNVSWSSSNTEVATVSNVGVVAAREPGFALIVVSTQEGGNIATCNVDVVNERIDVTGITLDLTELTLGVGYIRTLTPTVLPANATDKTVVWTSQNTNIAIVNQNGTITALNPGETNIIATTNNRGRSAVCKLTVIQTAVPVTGVTLVTKSLTLAVDGEHQLEAIISPSTATNKSVSWQSSRPDVVTVTPEGFVKAIAPGTAVIVVSTQEGGFLDTCTINVV